MNIREAITLIESAQKIERYLRGEFYHGTARKNLDFHKTSPAYFTQDRAIAIDYAENDASVDGETPYLITVRLHCIAPLIMYYRTMQDLHDHSQHGKFVKDLLAQGYDCAMGDNDLDEICVIDPSKIEVIDVIKLHTPDP